VSISPTVLRATFATYLSDKVTLKNAKFFSSEFIQWDIFSEWREKSYVEYVFLFKSINDGLAVRQDVNFANILQRPFLSKPVFRSFYALTVWICNFFAKGNCRKKLFIKC
jgi:hypothetical protein